MRLFPSLYGVLLLPVFCLLSTDTIFAQAETGQSLYDQAMELYNKRQFEKAMLPALGADSLFQITGKQLKVLQSKTLLAKVYLAKREITNALKASESAIGLLVPAGKKDSLEEADILNTYGSILIEVRRYEQSEASYRRAIDIKKKVLGEHTVEMGIQVSNLANLYFKKGDMANAVQYGREGIAIREEGISPNPKLLTAYTNLGIILKQVGLYQQSLGYYEKVAQVINQEPVKYQDKAAPLYQSMANVYHDMGDFDKAKQYADLAILNFSSIYGPQSQQVANVYYNRALQAADLKDRAAQLEFARKALSIYQKNRETDPAWIADCNEQICISYLYSNPDSALYYANIGRVLLDSAGIQGGIERASNTSYIATALSNQGKFHLADSLISISVSIVRKIYGERNVLTANYLTMEGNILFKAGQFDAALTQFNASLAAYSYTPGCLWDTLVHADQLLENLSRTNQVLIALYHESPNNQRKAAIEARWTEILQLLDYLRRRHQTTASKLLFAAQFKEYAEIAINWYVQQESEWGNNMAWQFAEKARSLALLEAFRSASAWNNPGVGDSLRVKADAFAAAKKKWFDLYAASEKEIEKAGFLLKLLESGQKEEEWLHILEHNDTLFYQAKYDNRVVEAAETRRMLAHKQSLLEYFVGENMIYLFVVRPDTLFVLNSKRDFPLEDWIGQLRQGIFGFETAPDDQKSDDLRLQLLNLYLEYAPKLYDRLIGPAATLLAGQQALIIVPDGLLGLLPFNALLTETPQNKANFKRYPYLADRYQISYNYSATLLKAMRNKKHRQTPAKSLMAFAPFCNNKLANAKTRQGDRDLAQLSYSRLEVEQAQKWMGGDIALGIDANLNRFLESAPSYRIIHLATHGVLDNRSGDYTYLALNESVGGKTQYEKLFLKDLYSLELNADLVVLSACETGVGNLRQGEGIISLGRAFAFAGAKSIVPTLWSVNNQTTAALMGNFYQALSTRIPIDQALQDARKAYFESHSVAECHPYYWAAFAPVGDMRPVKR
jgi:CHAT domain-containing protein